MAAATKASKASEPESELRAVLRQATAGDETSLPALQKILDGHPELVESVGNFAFQVEATLIGNFAGKDLRVQEATGRKLAQLRRDLGGVNPTPLEKLLADRIALCWLSLHDTEVRYHQAKDLSMRQSEHWQKRIDATQRRYLSVIKTLATVRKLALPALQVNIARKQVNILAGTTE